MYKKFILPLLSCLLLAGCDLFDYHPYDGKLKSGIDEDTNNKNIEGILARCQGKDTIRFIWCGDSGRSQDELEDFVQHINQNDSIDFVIHAGDLTEFGLKKEYEWAYDILEELRFPYVALIGNHDIIANGDKVFHKIYGDENFKFQVNDLLFLCLNTNAIEYDYSNPVPDFTFIREALLDSASYKRTVVAMHAPPGNEQFNNNVKDIFHEKICELPSLLFCLNGHTHNYAANDIFGDGIIYYACDNMGKRSYLVFTITPDSYQHELVRF